MDGWAAWNWVVGAAMQKLSWVLNETPTDVWLWGVQPRDVFMLTNWDADGGSDNCQVAHSQGNGRLHTEPVALRKPSLLSTEPSSGVHQGSAVQNRRFPLPWAPHASFQLTTVVQFLKQLGTFNGLCQTQPPQTT